MTKEIFDDFMRYRNSLHKNAIGLYDVPRHFKYLTDVELFSYWLKFELK